LRIASSPIATDFAINNFNLHGLKSRRSHPRLVKHPPSTFAGYVAIYTRGDDSDISERNSPGPTRSDPRGLPGPGVRTVEIAIMRFGQTLGGGPVPTSATLPRFRARLRSAFQRSSRSATYSGAAAGLRTFFQHRKFPGAVEWVG